MDEAHSMLTHNNRTKLVCRLKPSSVDHCRSRCSPRASCVKTPTSDISRSMCPLVPRHRFRPFPRLSTNEATLSAVHNRTRMFVSTHMVVWRSGRACLYRVRGCSIVQACCFCIYHVASDETATIRSPDSLRFLVDDLIRVVLLGRCKGAYDLLAARPVQYKRT